MLLVLPLTQHTLTPQYPGQAFLLLTLSFDLTSLRLLLHRSFAILGNLLQTVVSDCLLLSSVLTKSLVKHHFTKNDQNSTPSNHTYMVVLSQTVWIAGISVNITFLEIHWIRSDGIRSLTAVKMFLSTEPSSLSSIPTAFTHLGWAW